MKKLFAKVSLCIKRLFLFLLAYKQVVAWLEWKEFLEAYGLYIGRFLNDFGNSSEKLLHEYS